jgi:hypothetical protein
MSKRCAKGGGTSGSRRFAGAGVDFAPALEALFAPLDDP